MEASGSTPTHNENEGKEPTLADIQKIAEEASKTAAEAKTAAEGKQTVADTVKEEAGKAGIILSDEDCKRIGNAVITELEARGAFEEEEEQPTVTPPNQPSSEESSNATTPSPGGGAAEQPSTNDTQPRKRTFAEKFIGR